MDEESGRGPGAKGAWPQLLLAALSMGVLMGSIGASRLQEHFGTPLFAPCVCLVKPDFRFGTAVGILDQDKVTRRTACTAQGSGSWQSRPTSSST